MILELNGIGNLTIGIIPYHFATIHLKKSGPVLETGPVYLSKELLLTISAKSYQIGTSTREIPVAHTGSLV
jgi:hypothetical protein